MKLAPPSIFISSTCYDLGDARASLREALERSGWVVRMSDSAGSAFYVDPLDDSIESCLRNVESSDAIVCVLDRRYGGTLKSGPNVGLSATHVEVRHARKMKKPVFFFMRETAYRESEQLRMNANYTTKWVEPTDSGARASWAAFIKEVSGLPKHENWSNWVDLFQFSTDLNVLVQKRILDHFPSQVGSLALDPDRIARVVVERGPCGVASALVSLRNAGLGPVFSMEYGASMGTIERTRTFHAALAEGQQLTPPGNDYFKYEWPSSKEMDTGRIIFCEYQNRFGDKYRVEVTLVLVNPRGNLTFGAERLLVRSGETWVEIGR